MKKDNKFRIKNLYQIKTCFSIKFRKTNSNKNLLFFFNEEGC